MSTSLQKLKNKLEKVEKELEKVRGCSPLTDGWQTQKLAKKSKKWDVFAQEKMLIIQKIDELKTESIENCPVNRVCMCPKDNQWDGICKLH